MWWELKSVFEGYRDEYRGWRKFKDATGEWPVWSVLSGIFSIPAIFVIGMYLLIAAFEKTRRLALIYCALFAVVICGAAVWYLIRRAARIADVARATRKGAPNAASKRLENFLR
jgi:hypothetical protein